jgi:5-methyltetrahydropteroyltriglutamate--homocysteine methyltransferase
VTSIPTSLVGSYPQPDWLIDREALHHRLPPRVRASDLWRVDPAHLQEAQDDAVLVAIRDQERAGLDILTDGEMRRESYSNRFATALEGVDVDNPGSTLDRKGNPTPVPRVVAPIRRREPVQVEDLRFLRANTDRLVKMTVPGPFTMAQQAQNDFYEHEEEVAFAYADAIREEILDLFAAGADIVQLDEPWMEARPEQARRYAVETVQRALDGVEGTTALHICFGKTFILGVLALDTPDVETPETVAERIRRALPYKSPGELVAAPDCGMKYLPRDAAFAKLQALVAGARLVSDEVAAGSAVRT